MECWDKWENVSHIVVSSHNTDEIKHVDQSDACAKMIDVNKNTYGVNATGVLEDTNVIKIQRIEADARNQLKSNLRQHCLYVDSRHCLETELRTH